MIQLEMPRVLAILANVVYLASSSELCASHSEETSLLALKDARGSRRDSLWTAFQVKDGREVCAYVPPHGKFLRKTKIRKNILEFNGYPHLTAMAFFPTRYSVTDGQPVSENCVSTDNPKEQFQFNVGRKGSTKPADAFKDGLSNDEILYPPGSTDEEYWPDMNFAFEGNVGFSFSGKLFSHVMRFGQAGFFPSPPLVRMNGWNFAGSGCSRSQCEQKRNYTPKTTWQNCLKCNELCFQRDQQPENRNHQFIVWQC